MTPDWMLQFCGDDDKLSRPFVRDVAGRRYEMASNGGMLIAVPTLEPITAHGVNMKLLEDQFAWADAAPKLPWPELIAFAEPFGLRQRCETCKDRPPRCAECDGTTEVECDMNYTHPCPLCKDGRRCGDCEGAESVPAAPRDGRIGDCFINRVLLAPLAHVDASRVAIHGGSGDDGGRPVVIAGVEFRLLVMPLRHPFGPLADVPALSGGVIE